MPAPPSTAVKAANDKAIAAAKAPTGMSFNGAPNQVTQISSKATATATKSTAPNAAAAAASAKLSAGTSGTKTTPGVGNQIGGGSGGSSSQRSTSSLKTSMPGASLVSSPLTDSASGKGNFGGTPSVLERTLSAFGLSGKPASERFAELTTKPSEQNLLSNTLKTIDSVPGIMNKLPGLEKLPDLTHSPGAENLLSISPIAKLSKDPSMTDRVPQQVAQRPEVAGGANFVTKSHAVGDALVSSKVAEAQAARERGVRMAEMLAAVPEIPGASTQAKTSVTPWIGFSVVGPNAKYSTDFDGKPPVAAAQAPQVAQQVQPKTTPGPWNYMQLRDVLNSLTGSPLSKPQTLITGAARAPAEPGTQPAVQGPPAPVVQQDAATRGLTEGFEFKPSTSAEAASPAIDMLKRLEAIRRVASQPQAVAEAEAPPVPGQQTPEWRRTTTVPRSSTDMPAEMIKIAPTAGLAESTVAFNPGQYTQDAFPAVAASEVLGDEVAPSVVGKNPWTEKFGQPKYQAYNDLVQKTLQAVQAQSAAQPSIYDAELVDVPKKPAVIQKPIDKLQQLGDAGAETVLPLLEKFNSAVGGSPYNALYGRPGESGLQSQGGGGNGGNNNPRQDPPTETPTTPTVPPVVPPVPGVIPPWLQPQFGPTPTATMQNAPPQVAATLTPIMEAIRQRLFG